MGLTPEQVAAVAGIITTVIVTGMRGVWVWGRELQKIEADRDFWRNLAMRTVPLAEKATEVALSEKRDA